MKPISQEEADTFKRIVVEHKPATCGRCGGEMVHNVPRLGSGGGFVHKATGRFECPKKP